MRVQCSNCGTIKGFTYIEKNVNKVIYEGWRSYGNAIYCKKCVDTLGDRNMTKLENVELTKNFINEIHERNKRRR